VRPYLEKSLHKKVLVEGLMKVLSSSPSTTKKKKKTKKGIDVYVSITFIYKYYKNI
jgi:hypothetical protein